MSGLRTRATAGSPASITAADSPSSESSSSSPPSPAPFDFKKFQKQFDKAYYQFYHSNYISPELEKSVTDQEISLAQFDKLTLGRQYQRYISL